MIVDKKFMTEVAFGTQVHFSAVLIYLVVFLCSARCAFEGFSKVWAWAHFVFDENLTWEPNEERKT